MAPRSLQRLLVLLFVLTSVPASATIARRSSGTASGSISGSSVNVSLGSGVANGDLIVVQITLANTFTMTGPSGCGTYTQQISQPFGGGNDQTWVFTHVWQTGDCTSGINFSWGSGASGSWVTAAYTGAGGAPVLVELAQANAASTTCTSPSITPTTAADFLLMLYGTSGSGPYSSPSEGTVNVQSGSSGLYDFQLSSGSATGNQTVSQSGSNTNVGIQVAIEPATPTATPTPTPTATPTPECGIVQIVPDQINNNNASACSGTLTFTRTVGAEPSPLLVVNLTTDGSASPKPVWTTPTDTHSATWTCQTYQHDPTNPYIGTCWSSNYPSGSTTISVPYSTGTGTCEIMGELSEWKGMGGTVTLDQHTATVEFGGGNPTVGPTGVLATFPELSFSIANCDVPNVSASITSGGYVTLQQSSAGTFGTDINAYLITTNAAPLSTGWVLGSTTTVNLQIVSLEGATSVCPGIWFYP